MCVNSDQAFFAFVVNLGRSFHHASTKKRDNKLSSLLVQICKDESMQELCSCRVREFKLVERLSGKPHALHPDKSSFDSIVWLYFIHSIPHKPIHESLLS